MFIYVPAAGAEQHVSALSGSSGISWAHKAAIQTAYLHASLEIFSARLDEDKKFEVWLEATIAIYTYLRLLTSVLGVLER